MIVLVASFQAIKGKEKDLEAVLTAIVPHVQSEQTTLQYALHRSKDDPGSFLFYEKYADQAALDSHCTTPYLQKLLEDSKDLITAPPSVTLYEEIAAIRR